MTACGYHERDRDCRETPIVQVKIDGRETPLCKRHTQSEFWPPDLRRKLPGKIRVALAERRGGSP